MSLVEKDLKYIWHPFNHKGTEIVPVVKAEGTYVFGEDGKKYIDGFSSWWVNMHGQKWLFNIGLIKERNEINSSRLQMIIMGILLVV
jgi:acetylornithine/succinyldiaminopimelate/putrescine aminotransferase